MAIARRSRYMGTLVGVLAGDALGCPYETWKAEDVIADLKKRGGLVPFDYLDPFGRKSNFPKGRPSDDADHTAVSAWSAVRCRGVNEEDQYLSRRNIVHGHKSILWNGKAVGAGGTTREVFRPLTYDGSRTLQILDPIPSNGSLMCISWLALYFGHFSRIRTYLIRRVSEISHRHPTAGECCIAYVAVLTKLLDGSSPQDAIAHACPLVADPEVLEVLKNAYAHPRDPFEHPGMGAAVLTLHVALWSLLTSKDFREGITKCVALGGDTDTYGAVAGGLLGAYYGLDGIPKEWRDILLGREKMEMMANQLYDIALA